MRATLQIPKSTDILEHIYSLPASEQPAAQESIRAIERRAMADQQPQPGLVQLMTYLNSRGVRRGICILHISREWGYTDGGNGLIMVGDSIDDMTAGRRAGAATVLLVNEVNEHLSTHEHTDLVIARLDDLIKILEEGFEGRIVEEKVEGNSV
ncbi:hypothetical protein GRF29_216g89733 [Pseudopithomyces chartarum]|uniref:Uncharacterized protein n=1 Tax=Pseudopithomyces chartarum TaxID=1892770 RepID=A0AAN6LLH4_9PLEO|nr:hypothetical protein GRF29_216g89733 [Pseudopithomyces chartarum]